MPIGASRQVGHWKISGCLRDGCRLVHPVGRFIWYITHFTISTDSVWVNPVFIIIHFSFGYRLSDFNSIIIFVISFQNILIHVFTHVYSFLSSFMCAHSYPHLHMHSCKLIHTLIHVYSFMYTHLRILIHILIYVYSFIY